MPRPSLLLSVCLFWIALLTLGFAPMIIETMRLGSDHAETQGFGMSAFIMVVVSVPAAVTHLATLAIGGRWRQRTARKALTSWWIPVLSAVLVAGLAATKLTNVIFTVSENWLGPSTEWMYLTWPVTLTVIATGVSLALASLAHRATRVDIPVMPS